MAFSDVEKALREGLAHHQAGRHDDAERIYREILSRDRNNAWALYLLGALLNQRGNAQAGLEMISQAIQLGLRGPEIFNHLGECYRGLGNYEEAISAYQSALQLNPQQGEAMTNLGGVLNTLGRQSESLPLLERAVTLRPDLVEARFQYGLALEHSGRLNEAITQWETVLRLNPTFVPALDNVAKIHFKREDYVEASKWFERALTIDPNDFTACEGLFESYYNLNRREEALAIADKVLQHEPDHPRVHFDRGKILLGLGNYIEGFEEYEWRLQCKDFHYLHRDFRQPKWDGSDQARRTLLIYNEQGFGDMIQFARYIPLVLERGMQVIVEAPMQVYPLFESIPGITKIVPYKGPLPDFDFHIPLLSLARIYKTTVETIPKTIPYLFPNQSRVDRWKSLFEIARSGDLRVGLIWGGTRVDPRRSCTIKALSPLGEIQGIRWYSLQCDEHREQVKDASTKMNIRDLGAEIKDFGDTAAIMSQLDLIISIDTAAVHLAGALGKKTWALIPYVPDWRWFSTGRTTPWYPSMTLFRQQRMNDWGATIVQVKNELQMLVNNLMEKKD